jgi:hypothetical protein
MNCCAARAGHHAGLAQHRYCLPVIQGVLDSSKLAVHLSQAPELGRQQLVTATAEPVQVEQQPAEISVRELARGAQVAQTAPHTPAGAKAGVGTWRLGAGGSRLSAARAYGSAGTGRGGDSTWLRTRWAGWAGWAGWDLTLRV